MIRAIDAAGVLRDKLTSFAVQFVYRKADGNRRVANGTTNPDRIPATMMPTTPAEERKQREGVVTYFDLDKAAWRSCRVENILEIDGEEVEHDI